MTPVGDNRVGPSEGRNEARIQVGKEFDGPVKKRGCTDVIFIIIFLAYLGGMGYTCYLSFFRGDPYRLIFGQDSWGNACNQPNNKAVDGVALSGKDTSGLSKAYYFNPMAIVQPGLFQSTVVCVSQCPTDTILSVSGLQSYASTSGVQLCRYDIAPASYSNGSTSGETCPALPITPHMDILNRCIPEALLTAGSTLLSTLSTSVSSVLDLVQAQCETSSDFFQAAISDVERSWKEMLYLCAIAFGVALVLTFLMRFIAGIIIWTLVICSALGALGATGYCWYRYYISKTAYDALDAVSQTADQAQQVQNWLIIAGCVSGITLIILLVLLVMRSRIALVIQLFREAGKAIAKVPFMLLQPLWTLIFLVAFLGGLLYMFLYIETAGDPIIDSNGHVTYQPDQVLWYMKWYYIFGILWVVQFVLACHLMVIAGTVAAWYFSRDKSHLGWPILTSICRLIFFHLGSVLFGSFIIALVQLARLILAYIQKKLHGRAGPIIDFLLKCLQCCLWCFEKFLKFINKNAYIMVAIYGYNFCKGAKRGLDVVVSNILRVGAINSVGTFTLFLGKLVVVAITIVIGMEVFFKNSDELCYVWVPLLLVGLFAFLIADVFLSIYGLAIDTIFMCFCEDCEHNDGITKPYFMSVELMAYVENSKEALKALKARKIIKVQNKK